MLKITSTTFCKLFVCWRQDCETGVQRVRAKDNSIRMQYSESEGEGERDQENVRGEFGVPVERLPLVVGRVSNGQKQDVNAAFTTRGMVVWAKVGNNDLLVQVAATQPSLRGCGLASLLTAQFPSGLATRLALPFSGSCRRNSGHQGTEKT